MRSFFSILATGLLLLASNSFAQTRDLGAERLILDDGTGTGTLTISYEGPGDYNFVIPPGPATAVTPGEMADQTLRWDGAEWIPSSALLNNGLHVTVPVGHLELTLGNLSVLTGTLNGKGSGLTDLNASNVASGELALDRITTSGAINLQALMFNGSGLEYGYPGASALVMPFSQSAAGMMSSIFRIENTGTGPVADFAISNDANTHTALYASTVGTGGAARFMINNINNANPVLEVGTSGGGPAITASALVGTTIEASSLDGIAITATSANSTGVYATSVSSSAGYFATTQSLNAASALSVLTQGTGEAGFFLLNNTSSSNNALEATTDGNAFSNGVYGEADHGAGIKGWSSLGVGGLFGGPVGVKLQSGTFVGSVAAGLNNQPIPTTAMIVDISDFGGAGVKPTVDFPADGTGTEGQIILVATSDPDGANINLPGPVLVGLPENETFVIIYIGGKWKRLNI